MELLRKHMEIIKEESGMGSVSKSDRLPRISAEDIIFLIRGVQVIIDKDLAELYGVETKRLNQQANRNIARFPVKFRFQLSKEERDELVANCNRLENLKHASSFPYVYTEQGVAMLSAVLHTQTAIKISIRIMDAFVAMRHFLVSNSNVFQRFEKIEYKLIEADHKFEDIYSKLEERSLKPKQGIFFDGQMFDAFSFMMSLVKSAAFRVVLIDNYVDETVLTMLDSRNPGVDAAIYTMQITKQFQLSIEKHDRQYSSIPVRVFTKAHDRFLIVDNIVYHIGASLKDLGKKWVAFSLMEAITPEELLSRL